MNEAQTLFRDGILALREQRDVAEGRRLLLESLRLNPQNEMAWVWLARTVDAPEKRLECIERALKINPDNQQALEMKAQISAQLAAVPVAAAATQAGPVTSQPKPKMKTADSILTFKEKKQIALLLKKAEHLLEADDPEAAIEQWVEVLHIQVDHEDAMRNAVSYLSRMKYIEDAQELVQRALDAGTQHPAIYLTAIDIAQHQGDHYQADTLREKLVVLPGIDDSMIVTVAGQFDKQGNSSRAMEILHETLETYPDSQPVLTALGDLYELVDNQTEAMRYYDRAARLGASTMVGRKADEKLLDYAPVLTDRERGSLVLAGREAAGFGLLYIFLAWQDAGLNLLNMGLGRWLGVLMGIVGGYLLVTATSSPQQQPIAQRLGGTVPDKRKANKQAKSGLVEEVSEIPIVPPSMRLVLGVAGAALLVVGAVLMFNTAFTLLINPVQPDNIPSLLDLIEGRWW